MSPIFLQPADPTEDDVRTAADAAERVRLAEERGRSIDPTLNAYEQLAIDHGKEGVAEALIARANRRWENARLGYGFAGALVIPHLSRVVAIDRTLAALGLSYDLEMDPIETAPASTGSSWLGHVRWGADSAVAAGRLLMLGQALGAAAILRQQTERWTKNRASTLGIDELEGESKADFIDRAWAGAWERRLSPGGVYAEVSELLHGRGSLLPALHWEAVDLLAWDPQPDAIRASILLSELTTLTVQQTFACTLDLARRASAPDLEEMLWAWPRAASPIPGEVMAALWPGLLPLTPLALTAESSIPLLAADDTYTGLLRAPLADEHDRPTLAALAFLSRRARANQAAVAMFREEERMVGHALDYGSLFGRETRYVQIGEIAALAGAWVGGAHGDALVTASSAGRSAFHLWLEDDNRSMIATRSMVEAAARARTWRLKPAKATRLENNAPRTSPRDWMRAAGWSRLGLMIAALGEFSHLGPNSRWGGAIEALTVLQTDAGEDPPIHTARGEAVDRAMYLVATEALAAIEPRSPRLASEVLRLLGIARDPQAEITRWLEDAARLPTHDFGDVTLRPFDAEALATMERQLRSYGGSQDSSSPAKSD